MRKTLSIAAACLLASVSPQVSAATVVDVSGTANASLDGSSAVSQLLQAGTYLLTFTQGAYTAFIRFSGTSGCDSQGANCKEGFENSVRYIANGVTYTLGDGNASGGIGPLNPGNGYYADAATSFANAGGYTAALNLASAQNVNFFLYDDNLSDNSGGVSINIAAVPEPATWLMMIAGFAFVGFGLRRRKSARPTARVNFA